MLTQFDDLIQVAAKPYIDEGRVYFEFVRGKLRYDPVFQTLLKRGLVPDNGLLIDLGCGLGVLPALLNEAVNSHRAGNWPSDWPYPPLDIKLHGIELDERKAFVAKQALRGKATITHGDIRTAELPACSIAVILDVLMYMGANEQMQTLERVSQAICPGGILLMRESDASGGLRFYITRLAEQICCLWRGQGLHPLHYRSASNWRALLQELGFSVETLPMSEGTPFSNVLFCCVKAG